MRWNLALPLLAVFIILLFICYGFGFSLGVQVMVGRTMERDIIPEQAELCFQGLVFLCVLAILLSLSSYFFSPCFF